MSFVSAPASKKGAYDEKKALTFDIFFLALSPRIRHSLKFSTSTKKLVANSCDRRVSLLKCAQVHFVCLKIIKMFGLLKEADARKQERTEMVRVLGDFFLPSAVLDSLFFSQLVNTYQTDKFLRNHYWSSTAEACDPWGDACGMKGDVTLKSIFVSFRPSRFF